MSTLPCIFKLKITAQQMYTFHYAVTKEKLGHAMTSIFFCFASNLAFNFELLLIYFQWANYRITEGKVNEACPWTVARSCQGAVK